MLSLGRSVVVAPGQDAPPAWAGAPRVRVAAIGAGVADELGEAWRSRTPVVVELEPGLGLDDPSTPPGDTIVGKEPWELAVDLDLVGDRLHHAIWANAADGRSGGEPVFRWTDEAVALGARDDGEGGVVLPDGSTAYADGGPLDASLGVPVLHRIALEHGGLQVLGADRTDAELAPDQLAAVTHPGAGARVIAPAGSGKTRVLTERARTLLRSWGLPPGALAVVAFNRRAADELRARTADLPGLRIRTLNALGLRLLPQGVRTIDERSVRVHLERLVDFPRRAETDPAAPWLEGLGRVRLALRHPLEVEAELDDVSGLEDVTRRYRERLAGAGEVDFDEQVVGAITRLLADPPFRWRAQRFARVLLVDEFQDLTPAHVLLLRLLTGPAGSVFGVGDDDQTIYGYAGATPRWLVDFAAEFPGSGEHPLEVNYRCPPAVVRAASNLLTRNALRVPKEIRPAPGATDQPDAFSVLPAGADPAKRSAAQVATLVGAGAAPAEVAVLSRVNAALAPVQVLLRHQGLPVQGGVDARFLQRSGVRAALAWLSLAAAPESGLSGAALREAARRPKRGLGDRILGWVSEQRSVEGLFRLGSRITNDRDAQKVLDLAADVAVVRAAAASGGTAEVLRAVRNDIGSGGLDASAAALDGWSHGAVASHGDDLDALAALADLEPNPGRFGAWLGDALSIGDDAGGVTLASIHAVKGQEWPHVIVHHASAGLLPHRLVVDVEEERRVLHVGITRGRRTVTVVPGQAPSPFLAELDEPGSPPPRRVVSSSSAPPPKGGGDVTEVVVATPGLRVSYRGREVDAVDLPYGTVVRIAGVDRLLGHPAYEAAFESLRAWRTKAAAGKPAYTVFSDATLRSIAAALPADEASLRAVKGVGPAKFDAYADDLLTLTATFR